MKYVIGVDFDNTIITYDEHMHRVALERGLISPDFRKNKTEIRDHIRLLPDGEIAWRSLQATVYGPEIGEADLMEGVKDFFNDCREHEIKPSIVSHKTQYAANDETNTDLRVAALGWMKKHIFADADINHQNVFFESTRVQKVQRIKQLQCTHFIDDLEETFLEKTFPNNVKKIMFDPHQNHTPFLNVTICSSWKEISNLFF